MIIMKRAEFYIPLPEDQGYKTEPLVRGYKTHKFHNTPYIGMKIHLRFFSSHELIGNEDITT